MAQDPGVGASRKNPFPFGVDTWKSWVSVDSQTRADPTLEGSVAAQKYCLNTTQHSIAALLQAGPGEKVLFTGATGESGCYWRGCI